MLSENEKRIQELSKELGECLYQQSQMKEFKGLGEIEETVRDLMLRTYAKDLLKKKTTLQIVFLDLSKTLQL